MRPRGEAIAIIIMVQRPQLSRRGLWAPRSRIGQVSGREPIDMPRVCQLFLRACVSVYLACRAPVRGCSRRVCRVFVAGLPFSCASCARDTVRQGVRVPSGWG